MDFRMLTENIIKWWSDITYVTWMYFALFLPVTILIYHFTGKSRRKYVLLFAGWFFFFSLSGLLFLTNVIESLFVWYMGRRIFDIGSDRSIKRKERNRKKKRVLVAGVLLLIAVLVVFKYLDFIGLNIVRITWTFGFFYDWKLLELAVPVGISYFTLEAVAYLADVYWEKTNAEKNFFNVALFLSFFPKLVEGPISKYSEISPLFDGPDVTLDNLARGYQRILWGLFKKLVIADQLAPAVNVIFDERNYMDGGVALFGALIFTIQEYMDFSGIIDIAVGSGRIFGVSLAENFRQPFFAKNASDFWRRWHITLGRFFREYIFYPVSLSKQVAKIYEKTKKIFGAAAGHFVSPAIALFFVWLANGLWHGPRWTYIFYGMYYFVLILIENILEAPFVKLLKKIRLKETSFPVRLFRFIKLMFIVMIGEMFFRAETFGIGMEMFKSIFTDLRFDMLIANLRNINIDYYGYPTIIVGTLVVALVDTLKEFGFPLRKKIEALPVGVRYAFWYICIFIVIIFGAYGAGYDTADLIYAQF